MKKLSLIIVLALFSGSVFSQDIMSNTEGFSITLAPSYASWNSESNFLGSLDDLEPTGLGLNARIAYGFNQNIEAFVAYGFEGFKRQEEWDTYIHNAFDLGLRFNFGATLKQWRPFLEAALTRSDMTIDPIVFGGGGQLFKLNVKGFSGTAGAGIHFFANRNLSINLHGKGSFGNFNEVFLNGREVSPDLSETLDFTIFRIQLGLTYYFE